MREVRNIVPVAFVCGDFQGVCGEPRPSGGIDDVERLDVMLCECFAGGVIGLEAEAVGGGLEPGIDGEKFSACIDGGLFEEIVELRTWCVVGVSGKNSFDGEEIEDDVGCAGVGKGHAGFSLAYGGDMLLNSQFAKDGNESGDLRFADRDAMHVL